MPSELKEHPEVAYTQRRLAASRVRSRVDKLRATLKASHAQLTDAANEVLAAIEAAQGLGMKVSIGHFGILDNKVAANALVPRDLMRTIEQMTVKIVYTEDL